jgi:hypothetical protein
VALIALDGLDRNGNNFIIYDPSVSYNARRAKVQFGHRVEAILGADGNMMYQQVVSLPGDVASLPV